MKPLRFVFLQVILLIFFYSATLSAPTSGFYLPDSINEMTIRYRSFKNLIILPVMINDSISVNLILDTGCRNLVLFGKRFQKLLRYNAERKIQFSGVGDGDPVNGFLSLSNKVSIHRVLGEKIPVIIVPDKNVLNRYLNVDGVIGYDIFLKFEIELDPRAQTITFRPASSAIAPAGYTKIPISIIDSRPVMKSHIHLNSKFATPYDLMIDTGSSLGLLLKVALEDYTNYATENILGLGFNGPISGYKTNTKKLNLDGFEMNNLSTGIIKSQWHDYASLGMEVLRDYVLVLNYCKSYVCLKRIL